MAWVRVPLVPVALAFMTGIAVTAWLPSRGWWAVWAVSAVACLLCCLRDRPAWSAAALLLSVAALGALRGAPADVADDHVSHLALPAEAAVEGRIATHPTPFAPDRVRLVLDVARVDASPRAGLVQLTVYGAGPRLAEGQRIAARARLRRATGFRNPEGFDYAAFLARDGIHVVGAANARAVTVVDPTTPWNVEARRRAIASIEHALPPVSAALLTGLLLGARGELPPDVLDGFRRAGVYHVLAVSGFNVALIASAAFAGMLAARASRRFAAIAAIILVLGFAIVVGTEPSVVRAVVMAVLVLIALLLDRESSVVNGLSLAAVAILAFRPSDLGDPGFQLSFAATLGIVLAPVPRSRVLGAIAVSLAAQLAVLPITLAHFNQVSTIGVLANLAVVPLAGVATILGLAGVAVAAASIAAAQVLFDAAWPVLVLLRAIVRAAASVPGALVNLPAPHWAAMLAYAMGCAAALAAWATRHTRPAMCEATTAAAFWLVAGAVVTTAWPLVRPGDDRLRIAVLDVGRGQAIVIESPDRRTIVVAGATRPETVERIIAPYLWNRGVRTLAGIVTTADASATGERLRRLFPVDASPPSRPLGAVALTVLRAPDDAVSGVRVEYGLASLLIALDAAHIAVTPEAGVTMLALGVHGDTDAAGRALVRHRPSALTLLSVDGRDSERDPRGEVVAHLAAARASLVRTDRDGAALVVTDGRRIDVTRWALQSAERHCLDPEAPCGPARIR